MGEGWYFRGKPNFSLGKYPSLRDVKGLRSVAPLATSAGRAHESRRAGPGGRLKCQKQSRLSGQGSRRGKPRAPHASGDQKPSVTGTKEDRVSTYLLGSAGRLSGEPALRPRRGVGKRPAGVSGSQPTARPPCHPLGVVRGRPSPRGASAERGRPSPRETLNHKSPRPPHPPRRATQPRPRTALPISVQYPSPLAGKNAVIPAAVAAL
ncbi:uncharacterized protein LOC116661688 [Camelus ferus]|uniref:Uncharacterized protein LOC116661688 n=1 Tax=Camelus ferus TaxID=419612 RepID=A0A8B8SIM8_CAMFR|nr:uncharacterized protein LOC116661688 [Camelus ferus]